jgi:short-subunit dehydrogenase
MSSSRPVAVVTGASSGIGECLAHIFARNGHEVVLVARREDALAAIAEKIRTAGHKPAHIVPLDLSHTEAGVRLAQALALFGVEPQYIVNCAGFGLLGRVADTDPVALRNMIDVNCASATDLSARFLDSLARHRGGILNVASIASFIPGPGMTVYHATKAYLLSFSEGLRRELRPKGIRVTLLCPGPVPTGFQARAGVDTGHYPPGFMRSAQDVAQQGYDGLMKGRAVVVPGLQNKIVPWLPRFLPRSMLADSVYKRLRTWNDE